MNHDGNVAALLCLKNAGRNGALLLLFDIQRSGMRISSACFRVQTFC